MRRGYYCNWQHANAGPSFSRSRLLGLQFEGPYPLPHGSPGSRQQKLVSDAAAMERHFSPRPTTNNNNYSSSCCPPGSNYH